MRIRIASAGLAALFSHCFPAEDPAASGVRLIRTSHGIVHVRASNFFGAGLGVGYAFAQDNYCLLAHRIAQVNGELALHLGADALVDNEVHDTKFTALASDHYYRTWFDIDEIKGSFAKGSSRVIELADGYAEGVNQIRALKHAATCPVPLMREVTREDMFRVWVAAATVASGDLLTGLLPHALSDQAPPSSLGPTKKIASMPRASVGSNAWAVGKELSKSSNSVHFYNPHFPWKGIHRLHTIHVTIPGELDVMGAALGGFPLPVSGFTKDVAWGLTFSNAARWSISELKVSPSQPMSYLVGGNPEAIQESSVLIPVKGEPKPRGLSFFTTPDGPLMNAPALGLGWTTQSAFAVKDTNRNNTRMVEQFLDIAQAKSVQEIQRSLSMLQGVPWSYVVASDAAGATLFADIGPMPDLSTAQINSCVTTAAGQAHLPHGMIVLDGTRKDCRWHGRLSPTKQPAVIRNDYVINSNNSHVLPNLNAPLKGYSRVLGDEDAPLSLRANLGLDMVQRRIRGTDQLGSGGFSAMLTKASFDQARNRGAELLVDGIVEDCLNHPLVDDVDLTELCSALKAWDRSNKVDSKGALVFRGLTMALRSQGLSPLFETPASLDAPLGSPRGYTTDETKREKVRSALAKVANLLKSKGVSPQAKWGDVHRVRTPSKDWPIPGGLESEGIYDAIVSTDAYYTLEGWGETLSGIRPDTLYGVSYLHAVELGPDGPFAMGLLPYSQSTDPGSSWYLDQVSAWSKSEWIVFPFTEDEILSNPDVQEQYLVSRE